MLPHHENLKNHYEEEVLKSPNSKNMKSSLIYQMEAVDNTTRSRVTSLLTKSFSYKEVTLFNTLPDPRDGHSVCQFENHMIIFGGDRNKFPYNDLFTFILS